MSTLIPHRPHPHPYLQYITLKQRGKKPKSNLQYAHKISQFRTPVYSSCWFTYLYFPRLTPFLPSLNTHPNPTQPNSLHSPTPPESCSNMSSNRQGKVSYQKQLIKEKKKRRQIQNSIFLFRLGRMRQTHKTKRTNSGKGQDSKVNNQIVNNQTREARQDTPCTN